MPEPYAERRRLLDGLGLAGGHWQAPPAIRPKAVSDQRRTAMLRKVSHNVFVGPLTDCFLDPEVARCLRDRDRSTATTPVVGGCQPERCRNSRIAEHHLPAWDERLDQGRADLYLRGLPPTATPPPHRATRQPQDGRRHGRKGQPE